MSDARIVITGHAYGRRATLELCGDTLTWRARRPAIAENIATTIHDVRNARWLERSWSRFGALLLGIGGAWAMNESVAGAASAAGLGMVLMIWRRLRPRLLLVLEVGGRRLALQVAPVSALPARDLAGRIRRVLASGEPPRAAPPLP